MPSDRKIGQEDAYGIDERLDFVFKVIGRFDFYINSTNTKASLIIAWNGVVIGSIILKFNDVINSFPQNGLSAQLAGVLLFITGAFSLASISYVFRVVFPFLEPSDKTPTGEVLRSGSRLFFGDVAKMGSEGYASSVRESPEELLDDACDQAVILAKGLSDKMQRTQRSVWAAGFGLAALLLLLFCKLGSLLA